MVNKIESDVFIGGIAVGESPRVVGTIATAQFLRHRLASHCRYCSIVEVRLDKVGLAIEWLDHCRAIETSGRPVLLTIRLQSAGGDWTGPDEARRGLFQQAVRTLSAVDIELGSVLMDEVSEETRAAGKTMIVSCHDLEKTPPLEELKEMVWRASAHGQIVKVATMIRRQTDVVTLRKLLDGNPGPPLCVIGLGPLGAASRTAFPLLGSCLAYGYLDSAWGAGQLSVQHVFEHLKSTSPQHFQDLRVS